MGQIGKDNWPVGGVGVTWNKKRPFCMTFYRTLSLTLKLKLKVDKVPQNEIDRAVRLKDNYFNNKLKK